MARKKHISSHKATGAGKAAKAGGKVSVATSKIAATVAAVAVTGAFGAGAYALSQDASAFNPDGFASAYGKGAQDSSKGYQATTEQTDAQANRHDDASQNKDKSAEANPSKDAFSELPNNGSGTTAVAVDSNATPGTSTVVNDGKGDGGSSNGSGDNPSGPVIDNGGDDNGGGDNNNGGSGDNTDTPGDNNNGGSPDTPSTPDTPNTPNHNGGNNNGSDGTGDGNAGKPDADKPTDNKNINVIEDDLIPDKGESGGVFPGTKTNTIGSEFHPSSEEISGGHPNFYQPYTDGESNYSTLYVGQKASAWEFFCAIDAVFNVPGDNFAQYFWRCSRSEFADYTKKYFKIDSITCADGSVLEVGDSTVTVPQGDFTINVSYSFDGVSWHKGAAKYSPASSRVYVINPYVAEGETPQVLATITGAKVNLLKYAGDIIGDVAHSGMDSLFDEDGYMTKLFMGWKEVSSDGGEDRAVDGNIVDEPGRHVYAPRGFASFDSERYRVKLDYRHVNNYGFVEDDGSADTLLQVMVGINEPETASSIATHAAQNNVLNIPEGVHVVDFEMFDADDAFEADYVNIPSSVIHLNIDSGALNIKEGYEVSSKNPNYSSDNGVLASKDGTSYVAIPSDWTELTIPAGVEDVNLRSFNSALTSINIEETNPDKLPDIDLDAAENCNIVVKNEEMADAAIKKYAGELTSQSGNSLSVDKTEGKYTVADNLKMRGSELVKVLSGSSSVIDLSNIKKVCSGSFNGASADTVVLGDGSDIVFEDDSFKGSSVKYIVCADDNQAADMSSQLERLGFEKDAVEVVVKQQSQDGSAYFAAADGHSVILKASDSIAVFDGTLVASDGSKIVVNAIGPRAFENCENLKWAVLDEKVKLIGTKAFNGCISLEGLFIGSPDYVTVESSIFSDCGNVAFFASRAMSATFSGNEVPSYNSVMYCPTGSEGYTGGFQYFTVESGVADYRLVEQTDGGYLLYGCNDIDQPWLCLSGYASMSGQIKLPSTTTEIFNYAFANKGANEGFAINWNELDHLGNVDYNAFNGSSLKGDVVFLTGVNIALEAFEYCNGIESVTARGYGFVAANMAFASCHSLKSVRIESPGGDYASSWIGASIFEDCPKLESVEFTSSQPIGLSLFGYGFGYYFNSDWNNNASFSGIVKIPDGSLQAYIDEWVYFFAGYSDYDSLASAVRFDLYEASGYTVEPTEQAIHDEVIARLLPAENTLRMLLGADQVDEVTVTLPSDAQVKTVSGCTFEIEDGVATLKSVSAEAGEVVDFRSVAPEGCDEILIAADAFADVPNVRQVILSDKVDQIESGAFNGLSGLELRFASAAVPDLVGGSIDKPFVFGGSDLKIAIDFEGYEDASDKAAAESNFANDLLLYWPMQSLGCEDPEKLSNLYDYLSPTYSDEDGNIYEDKLAVAADAMLIKQENYFRAFMGMTEILDANHLRYSFAYDFLGLKEPPVDEEKDPTEDVEKIPVSDANKTEDNTGNSTTENPNGSKEEIGTNNNGGAGAGDDASAGGETKEPTGDDSGSKTDGAGGENAGGSNSGTVNGTEGGLDEPSGVTAE